MSNKIDKNIFIELKKRGVIFSVGRAYLFDQRVYFIATSTRYKEKVKGLEFNERTDEPILEREMNDEDFLSFSRLKDSFVMEVQNKDGAIFEMKRQSLKKHIRKIANKAPEMVIAIEKIVGAEAGKEREEALEEAKLLIAGL